MTREQERDIEQEKVNQAIVDNNYHGLVNVAPRVGKTIIAIRALNSLVGSRRNNTFRVLWVTSDQELRDVHTPAEFWEFGFGDLVDCTKFICYQSLAKEEGEYDIIILDEYQHITTRNTKSLLDGKLKSKHILGLSATPPKDYIKKEILVLLKLKEIAELSIDDAAEKGIINDYRINVVKYDLDATDAYIYQKSRDKYITEQERYDGLTYVIGDLQSRFADTSWLIDARRKLLYGSKAKLAKINQLRSRLQNKRGMIFMPYKKQVETMGAYYHSTSGSKGYDKFKQKKVNSLALIKAGAVGHTYEDIDYVIIGQITRDSFGLTTQSWARGLNFRPGVPVEIYIFCSNNTVEENWLREALIDLDQTKIKYI